MEFNHVEAMIPTCKGKMTILASWIGLVSSVLTVGTVSLATAGERYAYVRTFRVDGREVRLDE